jgi:hypothetical protein
VGMVDETVNEGRPKWWSFFAWPIVGAGLAFGILGLMTIGIYILPIALVGLLALVKWGGNRKSSAGLISGVGLPIIYIAYLNRGGPGDICTPYGQGGQQCTQEWSPWPWLIIGLGLVIFGVVVFLRQRRKAAHLSGLGHDDAVIASEPIPHPLDLPIENRKRRFFASGAAIWTIVGLISAIKGLPTVDRDAKFFFFATVLLATLAGIGATASALRGKRRGSILLLFVSVIYPTYFDWVFSLTPIVLACYLLVSPFIGSFRNPQMRRRNIQVLSILAIAIILGFAWLKFHVDPMASTESKRVQQAFEQMSTTVSNKEGVPTPWIIPRHVGAASYPDGSKASLWVPMPSPQGVRSNCFYVDEPNKDGASGFSDSSCVVQKSPVILERQRSIVVGFVNMARASQASVSVLDLTFKVPITYGYFLVPGDLSVDPNAKFTITFSEPTGSACKVTDVLAPGSSASEECVIS